MLFQLLVIEAFGDFTKTIGLSLEQWFWSAVFGVVSLPLGVVMRLLPRLGKETLVRFVQLLKALSPIVSGVPRKVTLVRAMKIAATRVV